MTSRMTRNVVSTSRLALNMMLLALFLSIPFGTCDPVITHTSNNMGNESLPVMHVFFEPIAPEKRFTSMSEEDDATLLDFWKQAWSEAGWEPRVLTLQDSKRHPLYKAFENELDELCMDEFGKLSLLRWLAMAERGGWLADYDAFPLRDFRNDDVKTLNNGQLTIYEAASPILVSGTADSWLETAKYLLAHAKSHGRSSQGRLSFWTDTLGLLSAWRDPNFTLHVKKEVLDGRKAFTGQALTAEYCSKRPFRGKRVVHIGHFAMLEAPGISPELHLPRHRLTAARQWLPLWAAACGNETMLVQ